MSFKGKKHTKETKKKMSKNHRVFNSIETRRKISESHKGKKCSKESIQKRVDKIRGFGKIQIQKERILNLCNGLHLNSSDISRIIGCSIPPVWKILKNEGISTSLKGKPKTEELKQILRDNAKINPNYGMKGKKLTQKHIEILRNSKIGKRRKDVSERNKEKIGTKQTKKYMEFRIKQIIPIKDTKIELKIQDFLTALKIEFVTHKYMNIKNSYQCDILIPEQVGIPQKTIIECDGDFFHCNPNKFKPNDRIFKNGKTAKEIWKRDEDRTKQLIEHGFNVVRLWENEIIKMNLNDFKEVFFNDQKYR